MNRLFSFSLFSYFKLCIAINIDINILFWLIDILTTHEYINIWSLNRPDLYNNIHIIKRLKGIFNGSIMALARHSLVLTTILPRWKVLVTSNLLPLISKYIEPGFCHLKDFPFALCLFNKLLILQRLACFCHLYDSFFRACLLLYFQPLSLSIYAHIYKYTEART